MLYYAIDYKVNAKTLTIEGIFVKVGTTQNAKMRKRQYEKHRACLNWYGYARGSYSFEKAKHRKLVRLGCEQQGKSEWYKLPAGTDALELMKKLGFKSFE